MNLQFPFVPKQIGDVCIHATNTPTEIGKFWNVWNILYFDKNKFEYWYIVAPTHYRYTNRTKEHFTNH